MVPTPSLRSFFRPANCLVLATYLLLSLVPFVPLLFGRTVDHPAHILAIEFLAWLAAWVLFKRPAWFHWLLIPAFFALPVEVYLQAYFGQSISSHHLGVIAETTPKESWEFLGNKVWLLSVLLIGIAVWWYVVLSKARGTRDLDWNGKSRWVVIFLYGVGIGAWLYGNEFGVRSAPPQPASATVAVSAPASDAKPSDADDASQEETDETNEDDEESTASESASVAAPVDSQASSTLPKLPHWAQLPFETDSYAHSWPFGLVVAVHDFWKERTYLGELAEKSRLFKFGAHQPEGQTNPQIVVMVIGESSRYDRWSLNGYKRETNPLLKDEPNLVSMSNIITSVSATRLSVPVLMSRKPATQSLKAGFAEKSFLSAFKEAGFKTYWLSNQMAFGQFDTPVSVFADEADVTQFMNFGGFTNTSSYDQVLLDPLLKAMSDPALKKLIVLHTIGNHWNYSHRYPREFDRWQPSLFGVENPAYTNLKLKPEINNSYDNSILYTDWFLSQVIHTLKSSSQVTSMMYVSDHGQTLYDGTCNLAFHGHNTQYEFHVPALVWYSDAYKAHFPAKVDMLLRHKRAKLTTENVFHSLLDMADIRYSTEHLEWSFLDRRFKQHKRYVDSYGWTDYDNATFRGDCREVIDKGKPLSRD